jgi:hypothetical protein
MMTNPQMGDERVELFMGEPYSFWAELRTRSEVTEEDISLINEVLVLRGKVSYYESRILEMSKVMNG